MGEGGIVGVGAMVGVGTAVEVGGIIVGVGKAVAVGMACVRDGLCKRCLVESRGRVSCYVHNIRRVICIHAGR